MCGQRLSYIIPSENLNIKSQADLAFDINYRFAELWQNFGTYDPESTGIITMVRIVPASHIGMGI